MRENRREICKVVGILVVAMLLCCAPPTSVALTYHFVNYPADQNGWTLSGTVTTDGRTGALGSADFVSASITVTKGTHTETWTPTAGINVFGEVDAVGTKIVVPLALNNGLSFTSGGMQKLSYFPGATRATDEYADTGAQLTTYWRTNNPAMGGTNPWVVAREALRGDANVDGTVNGADLNVVLSSYNKTFTGDAWVFGDFDGNDTVNGADLNFVLSNYNQSIGVGAAVPEPSCLITLGGIAVGALLYWRLGVGTRRQIVAAQEYPECPSVAFDRLLP
jgi:hypothetical protein